jgi:hypothetical protein
MIDRESPFQHDFFQIAVTERVTQIPAHTQEDDVSLEVTPLEGVLLCHKGSLFLLFSDCNRSAFFFATLPSWERLLEGEYSWREERAHR